MDLRSMIPSIAAQEGVDPGLLGRLIDAESGGNVGAVSPAGARGPAQLMPATARELGVNIDDPADNVRGGARYLRQQMDRFGDPRLALAAYNAGPGAVARAGGVPNNGETPRYVSKVMGQPQGSDDIFGFSGTGGQQAAGGSSDDIFSDYKPSASDMPAAAPKVTAADMRAFAGAPSAQSDKGPLAQLGAGAIGSVLQTLNGGIQANPNNLIARGIESLSARMGMPLHPQGAQVARASAAAAPIAADALAGQPTGAASRYARAVGEMAPAALAPGSIAQRVAGVVVPAVASETAGNAAKGTPFEGVARFAGGLAGGAAAGALTRPSAPKLPAADLDALEQAKRQAYQAADAAGVAFKRPAVKGLAGDVSAMVEDEGGAELYPKAAAMAKRIQSLADKGDMSLSKLDKLRAQVGERVMTGPDAEARVGGMIRDKIDGFIDAADPASISAGDGADGAALLANARDLNTRWRKVQDITDRVGSADLRASSTYAGGNLENAIRQNLRPLIDPKSPQRMKNLTPQEAAQLNRVVRGSPTLNAARVAGKVLDPRGLVGATTQTALGLPTHGVGPLVTAPLGMAATEAGKRMTRKNVNDLLALMAAGGSRPAPLTPEAFALQYGRPAALLPFSPAINAGLIGGGLALANEPQRNR